MIEAYREFKNEDGFSKAIKTEKKKGDDYNPNLTLYVFPEKETEKIDVTKEWEELSKFEVELIKIEMRIDGYIRELHKGE